MKRLSLFAAIAVLNSLAFAKTVTFPIRGFSTVGEESVPVQLEWDESWFGKNSAHTYNHDLARIAAVFAEVAYVDADSSNPGNELSKCYEALGFESALVEYHYDVDYEDSLWGNDQTAFSFATKQIQSSTGKHNLIFIVIRGTPLNANEWISNVNVSDRTQKQDLYHEGFMRATQQVHTALISYLLKNRIDTDNCYFLITGHSRGAAVANLLAGWFLNSDIIDSSRVYAYTFATPNVTTQNDAWDQKYGYIWNIVSAEDIVPTVPMNYDKWKFKKFGNTRALVNAWNCDKDLFEGTLLKKMNSYYNKFLLRDYQPFRTGPFLPIQVSAITTSYNKNVNSFYTGVLGLRKRTEAIFIKIFSSGNKKQKAEEGFLDSIIANWLTKQFGYGKDELINAFLDMHAMEGYLSWMLALDEQEVFSEKGTGIIVFKGNCDYAVFDKEGKAVASIMDGKVDFSKVNLPVAASSFLQDSVQVGIPANDEFSIIISKESVIPTHMSAKIQHYSAAGTLIEEFDKKAFHPFAGRVYKFDAGLNTLEETAVNPKKFYGSQARKLRKEGKTSQAITFDVTGEIYGATSGELGGGVHLGNRLIYGSLLASHNFIKPFRSLELSPGVGTRCILWGPVLLDLELFSKFYFIMDDKLLGQDDSRYNLVPAARISLSFMPKHKTRFFGAIVLEAHIYDFNDAAFSDGYRVTPTGHADANSSFAVVPNFQFGIRF